MMSISHINPSLPGAATRGLPSTHPLPPDGTFSTILSQIAQRPPTPEEVKLLATYLEWRMKATLFGLVGDNNPSPPLIFLTPDHKEGGASPNIDEVIAEAAQENQIDPRLIRAVIQVESAGNPKAVSPKGAMGLMQLMPETARSLGVRDHFDVRENILAGARYLKSLINRYNGNIDLALAAYNWGPGNLERAPKSMPMETVQYVAKVKKHWGGMG